MAVKQSCKDAAVKLIAVKDRTEKELSQRLAEKGYDEREIAEAMAFAAEYGYTDDRAYARKYIREGVNLKNYGFSRIRAELLKKGVDRYVVEEEIDSARESADEAPRERILGAMERRFAGADLSNPKERNRIFGYFARRGFSPNEIWGAINKKSSFEDVSSEEFE